MCFRIDNENLLEKIKAYGVRLKNREVFGLSALSVRHDKYIKNKMINIDQYK